MKGWPRIDGVLADYVDGNWLRDSPLKRRLREETAKMPGAGMQISAHQGQQIGLLARAIGVPPRRINEIVLGKRAVTADTDLRLARYFRMSEGFFLGLQADYDLMEQKRKLSAALKRIEPRAA